MNSLNERLFSLLADIWTDEGKERARHFCDYGEPTITSLYAFNALRNYRINIPDDVKEDFIDVLDFLSGAPEYESLKNDRIGMRSIKQLSK